MSTSIQVGARCSEQEIGIGHEPGNGHCLTPLCQPDTDVETTLEAGRASQVVAEVQDNIGMAVVAWVPSENVAVGLSYAAAALLCCWNDLGELESGSVRLAGVQRKCGDVELRLHRSKVWSCWMQRIRDVAGRS